MILIKDTLSLLIDYLIKKGIIDEKEFKEELDKLDERRGRTNEQCKKKNYN